MKDRFQSISVSAILVCACVIGFGGRMGRAADDARWQDVVKQLGSADFNVRETAQKVLDTAGWREKDALKQLAAAATDEEVKARILNRISAIDVQIASEPPPISLEVKDASLDDVAKALTKEMGVSIEAWPPANQGGMRRGTGNTYTLSVKDKPFWEVFNELSKQHGLSVQNYSGFRLMDQGPAMHAAEIHGAVAIFPVSITRSRTADLSKPPGQQLQPEQTSMQCTVALDPRLAIIKYAQPELTQVTDDAGNVLYTRQQHGQNYWDLNNSNRMWQFSTALNMPEKPGKTITSAKGEVRFIVPVETQKIEVTDVDTKLNQPLTVAGRSIMISRWKELPAESRVEFQFNRAGNGVPMPNDPNAARGVMVTLIDSSDGKRLWSTNVDGGSGGSAGFQFKGPIKLELSVATRVKEVIVPYEMKDLPLP